MITIWHRSALNQFKQVDSSEQEIKYLLEAMPLIRQYEEAKEQLSHLDQHHDLNWQQKTQRKQALAHQMNEITAQYALTFRPTELHRSTELKNLHPIAKKTQRRVQRPDPRPNAMWICFKCKSHHHIEEDTCSKCGMLSNNHTKQINNTAKHCSYEVLRKNSKSYTYKKINHLKEFLRCNCGRINAKIDDQLKLTLQRELTKYNQDPVSVRPDQIRKHLKRLGLSCYYELTPQLTAHFNPHYTPLNIPRDREELICHRFRQAEDAFERIKNRVDVKRLNFMSYPYIAYKICEMEGWNEYLASFQLLNSETLLKKQDQFWAAVCAENSWDFIPTIGNIYRTSPSPSDMQPDEHKSWNETPVDDLEIGDYAERDSDEETSDKEEWDDELLMEEPDDDEGGNDMENVFDDGDCQD